MPLKISTHLLLANAILPLAPLISTLLPPIPGFLPGAAAVDGAGPPAGAAPAAGAGPPAPTLQMRLPMLTLAKAFANKPGQKGSTFTPAALMRALILSSVTLTLTSEPAQDEDRIDAGELQGGGHSACKC